MWYQHKDFMDFKEKDVIESYLSEKYKGQYDKKSSFTKTYSQRQLGSES